MISRLISSVSSIKNCEVLPPNGLPNIGHDIPKDVEEFYKLCGGINLFIESDYSISIVPAKEFVLANPVIIGELCEYDISSHWYIIGKGRGSEYISIDLAKERSGRCYDSFIETHGLVGDTPIIAKSFTELLDRLIENSGERYYWLESDFISLGDAYDE